MPSAGGSRKRRLTTAGRASCRFSRAAPASSSTVQRRTRPAPAPSMSPAASAPTRSRRTRPVGSAPSSRRPFAGPASSITIRVVWASPPSRTLSTAAPGAGAGPAAAAAAPVSTHRAAAARSARLVHPRWKPCTVAPRPVSPLLRHLPSLSHAPHRQRLNRRPRALGKLRFSFAGVCCTVLAPRCAARPRARPPRHHPAPSPPRLSRATPVAPRPPRPGASRAQPFAGQPMGRVASAPYRPTAAAQLPGVGGAECATAPHRRPDPASAARRTRLTHDQENADRRGACRGDPRRRR